MSVLIRGAKMPSCCMFCPISNSAGCGLTNPPVLMTSKEMLAGRPDYCPLVPVPDHGRLIDADAIRYFKDDSNLLDFDYAYRSQINSMPTIIQAGEENNNVE